MLGLRTPNNVHSHRTPAAPTLPNMQAQVASGRVFASMAEALEASASCYQRTACQGEEVAETGSAVHRVNGTTLEVAGVWGVLPLPLMSGTA